MSLRARSVFGSGPMPLIRAAVLVIAISYVTVLAPSASRAADRPLIFVKTIGVGWDTDRMPWMRFVAFSFDGRQSASDGATTPTDGSGKLSIWTFPGGKLVKQISVQPDEISPDFRYVSDGHEISSVQTGKPVISFGSTRFMVTAFSRDSRYVAIAQPDKGAALRIRVMDLSSDRPISTVGSRGSASMALSSDGSTLAVGHWNLISFWSTHSGARRTILRGVGRYAQSLSFSPNGRLIAAGDDLGGLQIWDVRKRRRESAIHFPGGAVSAPAFSPDGRLVAVGVYGSGSVWLIDVRRGRLIDHQKVSDLGCGSVAFSPDGRYLITPSTGGLITWPYDRGGTIRVFKVRHE